MSGFAGIVRLSDENGNSAEDWEDSQKVAEALPAYSGTRPRIWTKRHAQFCFSLLKTGPAPQSSVQPITLDQETWLLGDVRLDGRRELISRLAAAGECRAPGSTDEELVLHAWLQWGAAARDKFHAVLEGDFSFGLWQPAERKLLCFRDLMGARPFFYAICGECICFGNSLSAVRQYPALSCDYDLHYFGDYLLNGLCLDSSRTAYEQIKRLPAGHTLEVSRDGVRVERFSSLPVEEPFRRKKSSEYVEEYRELLTQAVRERLPAKGAAVFLSGGLDSTAIAATAAQIAAETGSTGTIHACTADYQPLFDDRESEWAALAAKHIGIDLRVIHGGEYVPFANPEVVSALAEPKHEPYLAFFLEQYREVSNHAPVALTGNGGDDILSVNALPYLLYLGRRLQWVEAGRSFASHVLRTGKIPTIRAGIRSRLRRWFLAPDRVEQYPYPLWLNAGFEKQFGLRERWAKLREKAKPAHPVHPDGYASVSSPLWQAALEGEDTMKGILPVESRAPLLDARLMRFLLRVPPVPWCSDKHLLRTATKGLLPGALRKRAKTPLAQDPVQAAVAKRIWIPRCQEPVSGMLQEMVDVGKLRAILNTGAGAMQWINHYPLSLELWLKMR